MTTIKITAEYHDIFAPYATLGANSNNDDDDHHDT